MPSLSSTRCKWQGNLLTDGSRDRILFLFHLLYAPYVQELIPDANLLRWTIFTQLLGSDQTILVGELLFWVKGVYAALSIIHIQSYQVKTLRCSMQCCYDEDYICRAAPLQIPYAIMTELQCTVRTTRVGTAAVGPHSKPRAPGAAGTRQCKDE